MPNWCSTTITFRGKNAEKLDNYITEWTKESLPNVAFGKMWLGNCLVNSGIMSFDDAANGNVRCRGTIESYYFSGVDLIVHTENAWCPMVKMWEIINDKLNLDLDIIYESSELSEGMFYTNDPDVVGKFYIDLFLYDKDSPDGKEYMFIDYEYTKENLDKLFTWLQKKFPDAKSLDDIDEYFTNQYSYININKWKFVDISDLY